MEVNRVNIVLDQCPLHGNPKYAWHCGNWHRAGLIAPTLPLATGGFIDGICHTRLFSWNRIFTTGSTPPEVRALEKSFLTLHEWVPGVWPQAEESRGWVRLGQARYHGITRVDADSDHTLLWSSHAKRHLATFRKSEITLATGTLHDIEDGIFRSQVPRGMARGLLSVAYHRAALDPENLDVLVARKHGEVIAGFVCAHDDALRESMYILGYFLPRYAKDQAMTGLIDWWMQRSRARGYTSCNFGGMCGAYPSPWDPWLGLSNFKTHFGIERIWLPPSFWKITNFSPLRGTALHGRIRF